MGASAAGQLPELGWGSLALSFASLGVVCLVAYLALRFLAGRGVGRGAVSAGAVRVLARCPLEPRRSVYLIEAAGRCFLVGVGDGPMAMLAEVDGAKIERAVPTRGSGARFAAVLARALGRPAAPDETAAPAAVEPER
jgi:flagellar biogenesis protein FliO